MVGVVGFSNPETVAFQVRALLSNLERARPCKRLLLGRYWPVTHGDTRRDSS